MLARKSDLMSLYRSMAATAVMWASVGAAIVAIVNDQNELAVGLLVLALAAYPFRMKFTIRRIKADSFEEAMREIAKMERGEK